MSHSPDSSSAPGYVIEVDEESAGLVVRSDDARGFVFHAASSRFGALDGRSFASVRAAEKAAAGLRRRPAAQALRGG